MMVCNESLPLLTFYQAQAFNGPRFHHCNLLLQGSLWMILYVTLGLWPVPPYFNSCAPPFELYVMFSHT